MKPKKIPMRMCIGCRQMFPKKELMRVVKKNDDTFTIDDTGKVAGRGAYVCRGQRCMEICLKTKALNKAFEMQIPDEIYQGLREEMMNLGEAE